MIKGLTTNSSRWIEVSAGQASWPYVHNASPMAGTMRYDGSNLQIYDGGAWMSVPSNYATINLTFEMKEVLDWASRRMQRDKELESLAAQHPAVADAVAALETAQDKLETIVTLVKEHK